MESNGPAVYGNDGAFIERDCIVLNYANDLRQEFPDCPVVIKPCVVEGERTLYVTAYSCDKQFASSVYSKVDGHRASAAVVMLARAQREALELERGAA